MSEAKQWRGVVCYAGVVGVEPPDFKAQSSLRTLNIFIPKVFQRGLFIFFGALYGFFNPLAAGGRGEAEGEVGRLGPAFGHDDLNLGHDFGILVRNVFGLF